MVYIFVSDDLVSISDGNFSSVQRSESFGLAPEKETTSVPKTIFVVYTLYRLITHSWIFLKSSINYDNFTAEEIF